ncbi:MAG: MFS transporter [Patescibacteria group bacterium]
MPQLRNLFPPHLSGALVALYSHSLIKRVAIAVVGIFEAIFIFEAFARQLAPVLIYYLVIYVLYLLLVPLGAHLISDIGYRRSMRVGILFLAFWLIIFAGVAFGWFTPQFLWAAAIAVAIYKTLYWLPYHVELAEFTNKTNRARYVSLIDSTVLIVGIVLPIISAFIISQFGFASLMTAAFIVLCVSLIPLHFLPDVKESFSFGYGQTFKELFARVRRRELFAYMAEGVEDVAAAVIWPIFIFLILQGKYLEIGYVSSLVILVTALIKMIVGEFSDEYGPKKILKWGTLLTSIAWVVRIFIQTFNQIFLVGVFHNMAEATTKTAWGALWYQHSMEKGHFIDEYTALREMAINIGRILTILLVIVFIPFIPLTVTFILAALAVLLLNLLR